MRRRPGYGGYSGGIPGSEPPPGHQTFSTTSPGFSATANTDTFSGWVAGAGIEYHLWSGWTAKAEYLHYGFGAETFPVSNGASIYRIVRQSEERKGQRSSRRPFFNQRISATRTARSERLIRPSCCRTARIFRSVASSGSSCGLLRNDLLRKRDSTQEPANIMLIAAEIGSLLPACAVTIPTTIIC
jgi:hypothetical protein